jgi:ABC-type iron transport system FetAB permease component
MENSLGLIHVSTELLLISAIPLLGLAFVSRSMDLQLESPIVVGVLRTFIQLFILGAVLRPIFVSGNEHSWVVLLYTLFMIVLASIESSGKCFLLYLSCAFLSRSFFSSFCISFD